MGTEEIHRSLVMALPSEVAHDLMTMSSSATPTITIRTGLPLVQAVVTGLGIATTIITLGQLPGVVEDLGKRLAAWRRKIQPERDPVLTVDASGPNGRVSLVLTATVNADEIARLLMLLKSQPKSSTTPEAE